MIPARIGSQRLKYKNLAMINNHPLIGYSIMAAKKSKIFDKIIINSDSMIFKKIAQQYKVGFYLRPKNLGSAQTKSDNVVKDFLLNNSSDLLVWVNPIAPLQKSSEIKDIVNYFIKNKLNSLITVSDRQVHCLYKNNPVNFNTSEKFKKTQELRPVQEMVYSIMMWNSRTFLKAMKDKRYAILHGKINFYKVHKLSALIVKDYYDLSLIKNLIDNKKKKLHVTYHKSIKSLKK